MTLLFGVAVEEGESWSLLPGTVATPLAIPSAASLDRAEVSVVGDHPSIHI